MNIPIYRAKTLEGEWVEGDFRRFIGSKGLRGFIIDFNDGTNGGVEYEINPETLSISFDGKKWSSDFETIAELLDEYLPEGETK